MLCLLSFFLISSALAAQGTQVVALLPPPPQPPLPSKGDVGKAKRRLDQVQTSLRQKKRDYRLRQDSLKVAIQLEQEAKQRLVEAEQQEKQRVLQGGYGKLWKKET